VAILYNYLSAVGVLEEKVEDGGGDLGADGRSQIHLVPLQDIVNVPGPPVGHCPNKKQTINYHKM
jgi:hypothetical protein